MPLKQNIKLVNLQTDKVYPQIGFPIDIQEIKKIKKESESIDYDKHKYQKQMNQINQKCNFEDIMYEEEFETVNTDQSINQIQIKLSSQQKMHRQNFNIEDNDQNEFQDSDQYDNNSISNFIVKSSDKMVLNDESREQKYKTDCYRKLFGNQKRVNLNDKDRKWSIEDFEILQKLGQGRFGKVFLVKCKKTNLMVALKVVEQKVLEETQMHTQLAREIMIHSYLKHPNIVEMYGWFRDEFNIYLILEHCEGSELFRLLHNQSDGRFSELEVVNFINQFANSLKYLEQQKVIHRDIKPENILISNGIVKLTDFGWSVHNESLFNIRNTFCGTADYVSPEMLGDSYYNYKIDTWSLGVLTFELLVGSPPFSQNQESDHDSIFNNIKMFSDGYLGIQFPSFLSDGSINFIRQILQKNSCNRPDLDDIIDSKWIRQSIKIHGSQKSIETEFKLLL